METCFIIMPIGEQKYGDKTISQSDLKKRYDDLIKEALLAARPGLEIFRADDVGMPGSITTDILTRLMHSTFAVCDISYPNPNVFYELGIRHSVKTGTILIKEKNSALNPFDISHLRHIEYENTATGLKELSRRLKDSFEWIERHPEKPDNQFLELAQLLKFRYPKLFDDEEASNKQVGNVVGLFQAVFSNPDLLSVLLDTSLPPEEKQRKTMEVFQKHPEVLVPVLTHGLKAGAWDMSQILKK